MSNTRSDGRMTRIKKVYTKDDGARKDQESTVRRKRGRVEDIEYEIGRKDDKEQAEYTKDDSAGKGRESTVRRKRGRVEDIEYEIERKNDKEQAEYTRDDSAGKGRESTMRRLLTHKRPDF